MRLAHSYGRHFREEVDMDIVEDAFDEHIGNFNSNPYGIILKVFVKRRKPVTVNFTITIASAHPIEEIDDFIATLEKAKKLAKTFSYAGEIAI